jgi:putative DNA primase/helicase
LGLRLRGCLDWRREGLRPPERVAMATQEYHKEQDYLGQFLEEYTVEGAQFIERASNLHEGYSQYLEKVVGIRRVSMQMFGCQMKNRYPKAKDRDGNYYQGIKLTVLPWQIGQSNQFGDVV